MKCIDLLINQDYKDKEILLVMDRNEELYKMFSEHLSKFIRIIINETPGLVHARNKGIINSKGEIVVFIDDDAVIAENYISNLIKNYDDKKVVCVGGKVLPQGKPSCPEELYWISGFTYKGFAEKRCEIRNIFGCNMSFRRSVFEKVGLFDTNFGRIGKKLITAEETEFNIRILRLLPDSKIIYDPSVIVYHKIHENREKLKYMLSRAYNEGRSKALIRKLYDNKNTLSTENSYLGYLFFNAIPFRLKNIFTGKDISSNMRDIFYLVTVIGSVGLGYTIGRIR